MGSNRKMWVSEDKKYWLSYQGNCFDSDLPKSANVGDVWIVTTFTECLGEMVCIQSEPAKWVSLNDETAKSMRFYFDLDLLNHLLDHFKECEE